ncbi:hypothetical protein B484DRAFT_431614 [Ochromonadaceae sp. CCMP2298]|nr:hypothetical protein B484DRAFT_431614 [Ochromonadaceae sp. CCMP2298]
MCVSFGIGWFFSSPIYNTAADIPTLFFKENREISAVVMKVVDGDTYRVRHVTPYHTSTDYTGLLSENTIMVRIAAVDTPEIGKFGKEGQLYSQEAKDFASTNLLGKKVVIKLLARDRYGRALGLVSYKDNKMLPGFLSSRKDISEQLLEKGLAVVYRQGGAQYDGPVSRWNDIEARAQKKKRGMWVKGGEVELPSEYKKKTAPKKETAKAKAQAKDLTRI